MNDNNVKPSAEDMRSTADKMAVMAAYIEGKAIQARTHFSDEWVDCYDPSWTWEYVIYRIKPEGPRTWFVAVLPGDTEPVGYAYKSREEAERRGGTQCEVVEVAEVVK